MPSIELALRVRWADSDPAGRINFPRFFDYMEDGERELMRSCGLSYAMLPPGYSVPRVHTECSFRKMLVYDAEFTMRFAVGKKIIPAAFAADLDLFQQMIAARALLLGGRRHGAAADI